MGDFGREYAFVDRAGFLDKAGFPVGIGLPRDELYDAAHLLTKAEKPAEIFAAARQGCQARILPRNLKFSANAARDEISAGIGADRSWREPWRGGFHGAVNPSLRMQWRRSANFAKGRFPSVAEQI